MQLPGRQPVGDTGFWTRGSPTIRRTDGVSSLKV